MTHTPEPGVLAASQTASRGFPLAVFLWVLLAACAVAAVIRLTRSSAFPLIVGIEALAPLLICVTVPVGIVAVCRRQWLLGLAGGTLTALLLYWAAPFFGGATPVFGGATQHSAPLNSTTLAVSTANVLLDNPHLDTLCENIVDDDSDVIVLQEVTPSHLSVLRSCTLWNDYPFRVIDALDGPHGSAIFSRLPAVGEAIDVAGSPMTRVVVESSSGPILIVNVHVVAPVTVPAIAQWRSQYSSLIRLADESVTPTIFVGDFNATSAHQPLSDLTEAGMRDAFADGGVGWSATWPDGSGLPLPLMQLDHALVSQEISVLSVATLDSLGSDHRRVVASFAIPSTQ